MWETYLPAAFGRAGGLWERGGSDANARRALGRAVRAGKVLNRAAETLMADMMFFV